MVFAKVCVVLSMTYEGMLEEIEAVKKVKELQKELDIIKTENEIKDFEIKTLKEKIDMLQKQKKILQNSIRKYGKKNNS
jgi:cell division protein FtsB